MNVFSVPFRTGFSMLENENMIAVLWGHLVTT